MAKFVYYPEHRKFQIAREYLLGNQSYRDLAKKYSVSNMTIMRWCHKFAPSLHSVSIPLKEVPMETEDQKRAKAEARIQELESELELLRLKVEAQNILLDIVKEQTGVDVRKKAGAKQ